MCVLSGLLSFLAKRHYCKNVRTQEVVHDANNQIYMYLKKQNKKIEDSVLLANRDSNIIFLVLES